MAAGLLALPACGEPPNSVRTYTVAYTVDAGPNVTIDSVKYLDDNGVTQRVLNATDTWGLALTMSTGEEVEARAWGSASSGGQLAMLRVTWTISGVSTAGDSSVTTTAAPGPFTLTVPRQSLP
jgi:hypothetical protein